MGASEATENPNKIPSQGCRVMQILNPELESKLQPFTDYIIQPTPQQLKNSSGEINATIFSILDYSIRKQTLPISDNHLGARIKVATINDCSLKVTKVFPSSPCEKLGIQAEEYIVGLVEAQFNNLSTFAQVLHNIIAAKKEVFTIAICNQQGITRLLPVSVAVVTEWKSKNQGLLGCQLAEGWMHRFKGRPKRTLHQKIENKETNEESQGRKHEQVEESIQARASSLKELEGEQETEEWQEIQRKVGGQAVGQSLQRTFKGLLKNEYLQDASTICHCKIYDKNCEKCWIERDKGYHFFNKKTNRIITIPESLLLKCSE